MTSGNTAGEGSIEAAIAASVQAAVDAALAPLHARLAEPEPLVWTVPQVAAVLQVSTRTVTHLIDTGQLPQLDVDCRRRLIPRAAVERLVATAANRPGTPSDALDDYASAS